MNGRIDQRAKMSFFAVLHSSGPLALTHGFCCRHHGRGTRQVSTAIHTFLPGRPRRCRLLWAWRRAIFGTLAFHLRAICTHSGCPVFLDGHNSCKSKASGIEIRSCSQAVSFLCKDAISTTSTSCARASSGLYGALRDSSRVRGLQSCFTRFLDRWKARVVWQARGLAASFGLNWLPRLEAWSSSGSRTRMPSQSNLPGN